MVQRTELADVLKGVGRVPLLDLRATGGAKSLPELRFAQALGALAAAGVEVVECLVDDLASWEALRLAREAAPGILLGVGWIRDPAAFEQAQRVGAAYVVSPGLTFALDEAAQEEAEREDGAWFLPGVQTLSEGLAALDAGWDLALLHPLPEDSRTAHALIAAFADALPDLKLVVRDRTGGEFADIVGQGVLAATVFELPRSAVEQGDFAALCAAALG
jgi:2-dehydro-3-deoxyphosphogluconate aldolase/(4S)-4-hydroxy-2-oxoglutarate aldolase